MAWQRAVAAVIGVSALGGCVVVTSDTPLYDASQCVRDPSLAGRWECDVINAQPPRTMRVDLSLPPAGGYLMLVDEEPKSKSADRSNTGNVELVAIGKRLFVFERDEIAGAANRSWWLPTYRLTHRGRYLSLDAIDANEMHRQFALDPQRFPHEWDPSRLSIQELKISPPDTSGNNGTIQATINDFSPATLHLRFGKEQLQKFFRKHEYDEKLFMRTVVLKKQ